MNYKGTATLVIFSAGFAKSTLKEPAKLAIPQTIVSSFENCSESPEPLDEQNIAIVKNNGYMYNIKKLTASGWKTEAHYASWYNG